MSEFDPDDNAEDAAKGEALESLLGELDDCDLGGYDRDFVDDMLTRVKKRGAQSVAAALTPRQHNHFVRMKEKYDVEETGKKKAFF